MMRSKALAWALAIGITGGGFAQGQAAGRLGLQAKSGRPRSDSVADVNAFLASSLRINYESENAPSQRVLVASVIASPGGDILGECLSSVQEVQAGRAIPLPGNGICRGGGFVPLTGRRDEGDLGFGAHRPIQLDEIQLPADMLPMSLFHPVAIDEAKRQGAPVLVIALLTVDASLMESLALTYAAYPCVKY